MTTTTNHAALLQLVGGQTDLWNDFEAIFPSEKALAAVALALGAEQLGALSRQEADLARGAVSKAPMRSIIRKIRELIREGYDPLGEAFCALRAPEQRRNQGATYTPTPVVRTMVDWASDRPIPARIVDPGVGSARFLVDAANALPNWSASTLTHSLPSWHGPISQSAAMLVAHVLS
jgi:hypothetical protein